MRLPGRQILISTALFFAQGVNARTLACEHILAFAAKPSTSIEVTAIYLRLIREMALTKNALTADDLKSLRKQSKAVNPFEIVETTLSSSDRFSFRQAFESLLKKTEPVDWAKVTGELEVILKKKKLEEVNRDENKASTEKVWAPLVRKTISINAVSDVKASFSFSDGGLFAVTEELNSQEENDFWGTDLNSGVRTKLFSCKFGDGKICSPRERERKSLPRLLKAKFFYAYRAS